MLIGLENRDGPLRAVGVQLPPAPLMKTDTAALSVVILIFIAYGLSSIANITLLISLAIWLISWVTETNGKMELAGNLFWISIALYFSAAFAGVCSFIVALVADKR